MKKLIIPVAIVFALLFTISSYAVKELRTSAIRDVSVSIIERDGEWTADLTVWGEVTDEFGGSHREVVYWNFKNLPPSVQNQLNNFLKHLSREFNIATANESEETLPILK